MRSRNGVIEFSIKTKRKGDIIDSLLPARPLLEGRVEKRKDRAGIGVSAVSRC
jgi:hypothetical protein